MGEMQKTQEQFSVKSSPATNASMNGFGVDLRPLVQCIDGRAYQQLSDRCAPAIMAGCLFLVFATPCFPEF